MIVRVLLVSVLLAASALGRAAVVRLKDRAEAAGPVVMLADVADILTNDPIERELFASMEIGAAPEDGGTVWIDLAEIKDRLYRRGVRLDHVEFAGVRRTEIVRSSNAPHVPPPTDRSSEEWKEAMAEMVRTSAGADLPDIGPADLRVRIEADRAAAFLAENPTDNWELIAPSKWREGWQELAVLIHAGDPSPRFPVRAQIWQAKYLVAPAREIRRGEKIAEADLRLVRHEAADEIAEFALDASQIVGLEAKRNLAVDMPIPLRDLRPTPVVFRGQPITVRVRYRTAWIQKTFLAAADAGVGTWVEVRDPDRRNGRPHDYLVRVTGPHEAELPENAPLSPTGSRMPSPHANRSSTQTKERNPQ